ncbi:hypothetical protein ACTWPB_17970 [Nocardia sp. IBHARD005]|uniref:hypothetical protein n=1 Tax=Nocardia sp. IBHARD005 TaxID=3457765 RepID=UPI004058166B
MNVQQMVVRLWIEEFGPLTADHFETPMTHEQAILLGVVEHGASVTWRDQVLGPVFDVHGYQEDYWQGLGGSGGLLGPASVPSISEFRNTSIPEVEHVPALPPLGVALCNIHNRFDLDINHIKQADAAVSEAHPLASGDRIDAAIRRVCSSAWYQEEVLLNKEGWDDAPWWDYLDLEALLPWAAIALGLPGENPRCYGDLVAMVASRTVPDSFVAWRWKDLPAEFLSELCSAVKKLAANQGKP